MKTRLGTFIIAALALFCAALCSAKIVWAADISYAILIVGNDTNAEQAKLEKQLITEISRALSQKEGNAYKYPKARASQVLSYHFNQEREKQYCQKQLNIYPEDLLFVGIIELNKRMPQTVVYRIDRIASEKRAAQDIVPRLEEMLSEGGAAASVKSDASKAADSSKAQVTAASDKAKADASKASDKAKAEVSKTSDKAKQDAAKAADKSKQDAAKAADKAKADAAKAAEKAKTNVPNTQDVSTGTSKVKAVITPVSSRTGKPAASSTPPAASSSASAETSASDTTASSGDKGASSAQDKAQVKPASGVALSAPNVQTSPNGVWRCQVGAFSDSSHARILVSDLCGKGYPAKVEPIERGDKTLYRVFVGGYETKTDAQSILDRLHHDGYANAILAQISK